MLGTLVSHQQTDGGDELAWTQGTTTVHIGTTWRMRVNDPCLVTMRLYVKLL